MFVITTTKDGVFKCYRKLPKGFKRIKTGKVRMYDIMQFSSTLYQEVYSNILIGGDITDQSYPVYRFNTDNECAKTKTDKTTAA